MAQPEKRLASDPVLAMFLARIADIRPRIQRLLLFGSRARGDAKFESDYDILVVVVQKNREITDALYEAVMDVLLEHGRLISLKIFEEREFDRLQALQTPFMTHVKEEGVPLG